LKSHDKIDTATAVDRIVFCFSARPMKPTMLVIALALALARAATADGPVPDVRREGLARGRRVEIKGHVKEDGSIEARRIRLRDPESTSKIEGRVLAIDPDGQLATIGGFSIALVAPPAVFLGDRGASLDDLRVGQIVEVKGYWAGQRLHASRLRIRHLDAQRDSTGREETQIESMVEHVDRRAGEIVVMGRRVRLASDGRISDERARAGADRLRRDEDDRQVAPIEFGEWLTVGGRVSGNVRGERNFDRKALDPRGDDSSTATGEVLASAALTQNIEAYAKVWTSREFALDSGAPTGRSDLRVKEAYVAIDRIAGGPVGLQLGRQRFRDSREWFFDDYLDAARVYVDVSSWHVEVAAADGLFAGPEATRRRRDQRQAIASITRRLDKYSTATAFIIARDDRNRHESPLWIGGALTGRLTRAIKYWGNGGVRRGRADSVLLRGWAIDATVAYRLPLPAAPAFSAGYAVASGDESRSDGVDSNFRQTGLQDNNARFHGLKRFGYYGEVFRPELSNLKVLTVGTGMKPLEQASIDVVYHRYAQQRRRPSLPSNALEATGTGLSARLGDEINLIVSVQWFGAVDVSIVTGIFWPGPGVASPTRPARYWQPEVRIFF
jgi:alginate production protein